MSDTKLSLIKGGNYLVQISKGHQGDLDALTAELLSHTDGAGVVGAVATFSGITRGVFQGKTVLKLEYEAYIPMALKEMEKICIQAIDKYQLSKMAITHSIGTVLVGQCSVIIICLSPHRRAALEACAWAIDELKATVPIWKKEYMKDGSGTVSIWKENEESRQMMIDSR
jgi:molybdopterin synthase catalytic subunit